MKRIAAALALVLSVLALPASASPRAVRAADSPQTYTVMAAGDIACDPKSTHFNGGAGDAQQCHEMATSDLLIAAKPDAVLPLGDNQYEESTLADHLASYDPSWGRVKSITHPVAGNHEYRTPGAAGYFTYFGSLAAPDHGGYYSFDVGSWHFIALNSNCSFVGGCYAGSQQEEWLLSDLASHRNSCTVAYWHFPRFTSGSNLNHPEMQTFWDDLYAEGADIVLNGHDHGYERFAPQAPSQQPDPKQGITEFVVGTGGRSHSGYLDTQPNSVVRAGRTYGVLRMTLHPNSYDWLFIPEMQTGNTYFTEKGTAACHGTAPGTTNGTGPRAVPVVTGVGPGMSVARFTVDFTSAKPGQSEVLFGPGPGCSNLVMTATGDLGADTIHHTFVISGNDLPGTIGDTGITPGATYSYEVTTRTGSTTETDNNHGACYSVTIPSASG